MTILFAGGEDSELTKIGTCSIDTATSNTRRTAYTRCSLKVGGGAANDAWQAQFSASSTFWITGRVRVFSSGSILASTRVLSLLGGVTPRLALATTYSGSNNSFGGSQSYWTLVKYDAAGASTTLATSTGVSLNDVSLFKLDVFVNYAVSGQVQVYVDGTKIIDYSGDVTTNSNTTLSAANFGVPTVSSIGYWSELIVATIDTRSLGLATLAPAAAGNTYAWTGAYTTINETTLDDTTIAYSTTTGQVLETTVTSTTVPSTASIIAVLVNARAQKGNTGGPANLYGMVRTGGTDYLSSSAALPTSFGPLSYVWETNPATSAAWAASDITAAGFNIGVKSLT